MAAFSSFQNHFLIDSLLLPNNTNTSPFTQFCQTQLETTTNPDNSTNASAPSNNNEPSSVFSITTNKSTMDSSSIVTAADKFHDNNNNNNTSDHVTPMKRNKRKCKQGSFANSAQSKDMREVKEKKQKKRKDGEIEKKGEKKAIEEPPTGYIHVRARRGQATDSHSLAERVRRERISERMKLLQALVPGCDKVTGKALMLDEIINYVQSLQHQVEFLSLKLASMNPMSYDFGMDLESFMVTPNQNLSSLPSPLPRMQEQCSPTPVSNNYSLLDNNPENSFLFQNAQVPNALPQGNRQVLWEVDDQRHKIINQSGFSNNNNNLFSFH